MMFAPQGNAGEFINIIGDNLTYLGPKDLTQYFIRNTSMAASEDKTSAHVKVWQIENLVLETNLPVTILRT